MKHLKKYNEALTSSDLENFDSEEISLSLAEYWIPCNVALPENGQKVIIFAPKAQMSTWAICNFEKGISMEERRQMEGTERAITYTAADEHNNNRRPYCWRKMGPGTYFGQDVTHWLPLPKNPEYL
jgi:hypothetical protein